MNTTEANKFGIEIETVGLDKNRIADAIQTVVGGIVSHGYEKASVTCDDGRVWNVVRDGSLNGGNLNGEIVSPILTYSDLDALQNIVRAVREAGARADSSCGIHIHVDGSRFTVRSVMNLINMIQKYEPILERALGVAAHRRHYCKSIDRAFVARVAAAKPKTMKELQTAWYGYELQSSPSRYDASRYHAINLNSFFYRGTVEFRYFNGTLHAGEVKAYVQFVLALAQRAQTMRAASAKPRRVEEFNERWAMRGFLTRLKMFGAEFKTARTHLTKRIEGKSNRVAPITTPETP
jgi:hypothetical protein